MVLEVKLLDGGLGLETGEAEAAGDGMLAASFQFQIGQPLEGGGDTEVFGSGLGQSVSSCRLMTESFNRESLRGSSFMIPSFE
jgi:hypothetical protein